LEDHAYQTPDLPGIVYGIQTIYMDRSNSGFQEAADQPDECGFATPVGTADEKELAFLNGKSYPF
jgi:hypothetical protein